MWEKVWKILVGIGLVVVIAALDASCEEKIYDGIGIDEIARILDKNGFTVTRGKAADGRTYLNAFAGKNGFLINVYNCKEDKACKAMEFNMGFSNAKGATIERINEWNMKTTMTKAYRQGSDARLEMDIPVEGGITKQYIENYIATWKSNVERFANYLSGASL